ncbi:hypothetical protein LCGC14_2917960 [marine sediment metagenome]|uniref:HNH domain-containing protein n=1 Tax=marine sediment metagenome TaxID=412755 RepID=A0A0F8XPZ3_9ZZZZ
MPKKSERTRLTDRLDEIILKIIRLIHKGKCQRCRKDVEGSNSQTSHVIPKGNGASWRRFDLMNIQHLCHYCHLGWWHKNILEAAAWFRDNWPELDEYLEKYRGGKPAKISTIKMKELHENYKQKLEDLKG